MVRVISKTNNNGLWNALDNLGIGISSGVMGYMGGKQMQQAQEDADINRKLTQGLLANMGGGATPATSAGDGGMSGGGAVMPSAGAVPQMTGAAQMQMPWLDDQLKRMKFGSF